MRKPSKLEFELVFWLGIVLPGVLLVALYVAVFYLIFFTSDH